MDMQTLYDISSYISDKRAREVHWSRPSYVLRNNQLLATEPQAENVEYIYSGENYLQIKSKSKGEGRGKCRCRKQTEKIGGCDTVLGGKSESGPKQRCARMGTRRRQLGNEQATKCGLPPR